MVHPTWSMPPLFLEYYQKNSSMKYFENYMDDLVVREDDNGNRFIRTESCRKGEECGPCPKDSKSAFGGESFGYFHVLDPITEDEYWSYGVTWKYGKEGNEKVPIFKVKDR